MNILLFVMGFAYIVAGANHFRNPEFYLKIMPPYLPAPLALIYISGVAEIALGILVLVPRTRSLAAWGIIALLVAVFPANIYMYHHGGAAYGTKDWVLLARLPLQLLLIYWAYRFT